GLDTPRAARPEFSCSRDVSSTPTPLDGTLVLNTKPGTTTLPPVIAAMNAQVRIDYSSSPPRDSSGRCRR
ncbi:MAG TPA: hypothetical protein VHO73_05115, partial [Methylomirabilota bacterium]|nr:hypothetical protein [Methylomirabilota bacterium]